MRKLLFRIGTASISISAISIALAGCGQASQPPAREVNQQRKAHEMHYTIPDFVQKLIDVPVPEDGKIHVQKHGRLRIDADTLDCFLPRQIHASLKDSAPYFYGVGPGKHIPISRQPPGGGICQDSPKTQLSYLSLRTNSNGRPYTLTLAVWQGDAAWVVSIVRTPERLHPSVLRAPMLASLNARLKVSVARDAKDLEKLFSQHLSGGQ